MNMNFLEFFTLPPAIYYNLFIISYYFILNFIVESASGFLKYSSEIFFMDPIIIVLILVLPPSGYKEYYVSIVYLYHI